MLLIIDKKVYYKLFKINSSIKLKNIITEYKDTDNKKHKKITASYNSLKIDNIKTLLSVRYSTTCGKKIDITTIVQKHYFIENANLKPLNELTSHLNNFFHIYISFFCGRCEGKGHHKGIINNYLKSKCGYNEVVIERFFKDTEHGFFHGLMASFICYLINIDGNLVTKVDKLEKIFMSATLHDFLKANGIEQKLHDKELRKVYPDLLEETYVHSDPPEKFHNHHLIIADRLELRRYSDYKTWVDDRFNDLYKKMKNNTREMLDIFYTNVRPALEYLYTNRKKTFLRHGTEVKQECVAELFPPCNTTYYKISGYNSNLYPIEIDMVPFCSVVNNTLVEGNKWHNDNQYGHCSNHDGNSIWNVIKGYITIDDFSKNGKIINTNERDHLFAESSIKTDKWTFLYQNLDSPLDLQTVTGDTKYLDSRNEINPYEYLFSLINTNQKVISQETVFLLFQFVRMFYCRIVVLQ